MPAGIPAEKIRNNTLSSVINKNLVRDCIQVTDVPLAGDRGGSTGSYFNRKDKQHDDYISLLSNRLELHEVKVLLFSYQSIGRIENLVGLNSLTKLYLDNNRISKIENLTHLTLLKWLDLSFNQITEIEGLDTLTRLRDLSLYSNQITVIKNLENLPELTSLSLGENRIEFLDEAAKYLHYLPSIRMLTLSGNKICQLKSYKSRILAFVGDKLRYLDNRLILPKDIATAKEQQTENLVPIHEADEIAEEVDKTKKEKEKECAKYEKYNCPDPHKLISEMEQLQPEGFVVLQMLQCDEIKDRVKDIFDKYHEDVLKKAQELAKFMEQMYFTRNDDQKDFNDTLEWYKNKLDRESKQHIKEFETSLKQDIPYGLQAQEEVLDACDLEPDKIRQHCENLRALKTALLEKECDMYDAFKSVIDFYDDQLSNFKSTMTEFIFSRFDELRLIDRQMGDNIKKKILTYFDDRAATGTETMLHTGNDYTRLLDNKEECLKALSDFSEFHSRRFDEIEETLKKWEENYYETHLKDAQQKERVRNRARIAEINTYCQRYNFLSSWDSCIPSPTREEKEKMAEAAELEDSEPDLEGEGGESAPS